METNLKSLRNTQKLLEEMRGNGRVTSYAVKSEILLTRSHIAALSGLNPQAAQRAENDLYEAEGFADKERIDDSIYTAHMALTMFLNEIGFLL